MIIKIITIKEFLQESGFEKREKYFDWLTGGGPGRGGRGRHLVLSFRCGTLWDHRLFVFWVNQVGCDFVDGRFSETGCS